MAVLNEGLETLGTDEYMPDGRRYPGVFQESGLQQVGLPPTLKRVEYRAFMDCERLRAVQLPEGLEYVGKTSFSGAGIESVEFPASLRTVAQASFCMCKNLTTAKFHEGLEVLGTDEYPPEVESF